MKTMMAFAVLTLYGCGAAIDSGSACRTAATHGFTACRLTDTNVIAPTLSGCRSR